MVRVATWNVNSIRARIDAVAAWLERRDPDVLLIQETKCGDDVFDTPGVSGVAHEHGIPLCVDNTVPTPYLVQPMEPHQVPPTPGDCVEDPTDLELYLGNRIEGRTGRDTPCARGRRRLLCGGGCF